MNNVVSFNRKVNENVSVRYVIICHEGVDDELMSKINSNHEEDKENYKYGFYSNYDIACLGIHIPPAYSWELLIMKHTCERRHRMENAPEWVIRNEAGYYYNSYSDVFYAGPNIYKENYEDVCNNG